MASASYANLRFNLCHILRCRLVRESSLVSRPFHRMGRVSAGDATNVSEHGRTAPLVVN